jgi:hypothetical protein
MVGYQQNGLTNWAGEGQNWGEKMRKRAKKACFAWYNSRVFQQYCSAVNLTSKKHIPKNYNF